MATWVGLEDAVGALEGGQATAFATGMAAASACLFEPACGCWCCRRSYLARALVNDLVEQARLQVRFVDITDTAAGGGLTEPTWCDRVADQPHARRGRSRHDHRGRTCRWRASRGRQHVRHCVCPAPRAGADLVMHSGTKFIGGHSDLMIGLVVAQDDVLHDRIRHTPGS
ncbi:MAG: PLP-dependent transferase [Ilumatobacteraceae bacterium]